MKNKKLRALGYAFATMLILIGVVSIIVGVNWFNLEVGAVVLFFIFLIPAVGIFVYLGCTEEDEEEKLPNELKGIRNYKFKAIESALWLLAVALFFIIGFNLNGWSYAWVIFIIAAALSQLIKAFFYQFKE
ncbi:hypothetical protein [Clostridium tarantellae]|uniref:DUF2178 domain-containing protein n=1 Tax=Clostridium tarantellae TaxID=39493 RepID=A0A6I1MM65_9CLOT|nr:hypothetical protein [Clostridium tarantellae]MPQ43843.1 hypothetical protein [Clostridium tarantellae]